MKTVILCGGLGTRMREQTEYRPKPLVDVGGRPVLWHIMKLYEHYGFRQFVMCLGYRGNMIKEFFLNYEAISNDFTIDLGREHSIRYHDEHGEQDFSVTLADTGQATMTGGRVKRIERYIDSDTFMVTYGDGVADVDIGALVDFHHAHGRLATVTAVHLVTRFGVLEVDSSSQVSKFAEKPALESWINAGFFVFNRRVFDYLGGDECILERDPLERLAREGQLMAFQHKGFFYAMDTYRDHQNLQETLGQRKTTLESLVNMNTFWQDRPTLVTGATGLVGAWLIKRLADAGADIVCLVRDWVPQSELVQSGLLERVKVVRGDVRDQGVLERTLGEYSVDTVLHLAAQAIVGIANRNPVSTFETNIQGTWALLEACRRSPLVKQIVIASSDKAYGDQDVLPYDEQMPLIGRHPYDVSKSCADLIAQAYATTYDLPVAITRCGNFYGGGDLNWNRIVPGTVRSVLRGQRPIIRSDGQFIRDYFYVEDGAAAYMLLAEKLAARPELKGHAFNFSNELQVTVLQLVERILTVMQSDLEPEVLNEASNEIRHQYLAADKAREMLDWSPLFNLDTGLQRAIDWYQRFFEDTDRD